MIKVPKDILLAAVGDRLFQHGRDGSENSSEAMGLVPVYEWLEQQEGEIDIQLPDMMREGDQPRPDDVVARARAAFRASSPPELQ